VLVGVVALIDVRYRRAGAQAGAIGSASAGQSSGAGGPAAVVEHGQADEHLG
jgi:hypothetical protein